MNHSPSNEEQNSTPRNVDQIRVSAFPQYAAIRMRTLGSEGRWRAGWRELKVNQTRSVDMGEH